MNTYMTEPLQCMNKSFDLDTLHTLHIQKYVDLAISAKPVADMCITLSTEPYNLHRQTLAVEWPTLKSSVTFNVAAS